MQVKPLNSNIIFTFDEETSSGGFIPKTGGLIIVPQNIEHNREPKWGMVESVGPSVHDVKPGDYILIEPLMWSLGFELEGKKFWKTDESKVMAISDVPVIAY